MHTNVAYIASTRVEIRRQHQSPSPMEHAAAAPPGPGVGAGALAASLKQIIGFFDAGMLTEAEFTAAKATVLGLAGLATPTPAALPAASPVLATVMAEELAEPVLAAVVPVQTTVSRPIAAVAARGCARKKKKEKRKRDDAEDVPAWLPGSPNQANGGGPAAPRRRGPKAQGRPSKFTGVCWNTHKRKWKAGMWHGGRNQYLGTSRRPRRRTRPVRSTKRRGVSAERRPTVAEAARAHGG